MTIKKFKDKHLKHFTKIAFLHAPNNAYSYYSLKTENTDEYVTIDDHGNLSFHLKYDTIITDEMLLDISKLIRTDKNFQQYRKDYNRKLPKRSGVNSKNWWKINE